MAVDIVYRCQYLSPWTQPICPYPIFSSTARKANEYERLTVPRYKSRRPRLVNRSRKERRGEESRAEKREEERRGSRWEEEKKTVMEGSPPLLPPRSPPLRYAVGILTLCDQVMPGWMTKKTIHPATRFIPSSSSSAFFFVVSTRVRWSTFSFPSFSSFSFEETITRILLGET